MTSQLFTTIVLSLIAGIGASIFIASFILPVSSMTSRLREGSTGPRVEGIVGHSVLSTFAVDLSQRIKSEGNDLEDRLTRSGWHFKSPTEFHTSRMLSSLLFMLGFIALALTASYIMEISFGFVPIASFATIGVITGFSNPSIRLNNAINDRRKRLKYDMSYGLERVALFLQTEPDLASALAQTEGMGLFGEACVYISTQIGLQKPISEIVAHVEAQLPKSVEFEEFLILIHSGIHKGQAIEEPLRIMAETMRDELSLTIIEDGHKANIKVTLITVGTAFISFIGVTLIPLMMQLFEDMM